MHTISKGISKGALPILIILLAQLLNLSALSAETRSPVVRAVLFSSPTCPHCATVREEVLPPLAARYGSKLQVVIISTATPDGQEMFLSACLQYGRAKLSVPLLVVGNTSMTGSEEIPQKFPDLIEKLLAEGGSDWPSIPGLSAKLAGKPAFASPAPAAASAAAHTTGSAGTKSEDSTEQAEAVPQTLPEPGRLPAAPAVQAGASKTGTAASASPAAPQAAAASIQVPSAPGESAVAQQAPPTAPVHPEASGIIDLTGGEAENSISARIGRDPYGNGLAILVLVAMLGIFLRSLRILGNPAGTETGQPHPRYDWLMPILMLAGLGVAAYLSHVELKNVEAVCGPVGDCNTVQQSKYARLFGILPIGVLGLAGFGALLAAWMLRRWASVRIAQWASVAILAMTGFGLLFSIYLTFLEPFVIGATCLWCLSSAVLMTTLYVRALRPGRAAWKARTQPRLMPQQSSKSKPVSKRGGRQVL